MSPPNLSDTRVQFQAYMEEAVRRNDVNYTVTAELAFAACYAAKGDDIARGERIFATVLAKTYNARLAKQVPVSEEIIAEA